MIKEFLQNLSAMSPSDNPTDSQLKQLGGLMVELAKSLHLDRIKFPEATHWQELVYPLHIADTGPSLYLVSDAPGIQSAPHEHNTWAVIVGISGNEMNTVFEVCDELKRTVKPVSSAAVKELDVLCLRSNAIHSTFAAGSDATYHLHLYGKSLTELPPYASRCFVAA